MPIYVVGAGPGDLKLLTIRAVELLKEADVVAFGELVPAEVVETYAPRAKRVKLGHRKAEHNEVVKKLIEEAARGYRVVVLKNGDPTLFGRGLWICREAEARGVPCEIVPGVSAYAAAAALYKIDLTDGEVLRHVALLSYPHVDSEVLKRVAADTIVVHMMGDRLSDLSKSIAEACVKSVEVYFCYSVSTGGECVKTTPEELTKFKGLRPAVVIIRKCR